MTDSKTTRITAGGLARQGAVWVFSASYLPALVATCLMSGTKTRSTVGPKMARGWGKTAALLAGVDVRLTGAAAAALNERRPRVLTFNHASTLDVLVGASLLPDGGVLALKKEMRDLPFLGSACSALGSVFLDRGDRESAYASLQEGARRIQAETLQVLIAPEGTRSSDGTLGRFKLGAFHLAHAAKVPILPIVFHGAAEIWPRGDLAPRGGTLHVDILDESLIESGEPDALRRAADRLREDYLAALMAGPADH